MSLEIIQTQRRGINFWCCPEWESRGVVHGLFGREFDASGQALLAPATNLPGVMGRVPLALLKQIHGREICFTEIWPKGNCRERPVGDGWLIDVSTKSSAAQVLYAVQTADCFPVYILDPIRQECALLHAGWRGTVSGIVVDAVNLLCSRGSQPENLEGIIGPAAQSCCYEVGAEVLDALRPWEERLAEGFSLVKAERYFARLQALIAAQLNSLGVLAESMGVVDICTICDERFFSYRREKAHAGRQVSVILGRAVVKKEV